ncbi:hypothetical protein [Nostoc flagelliforme]|nr:hypothetical protein [Nostoc flagelliforme]
MTKILVIDMEEQARNIFLRCLEEEGFDAIAAYFVMPPSRQVLT